MKEPTLVDVIPVQNELGEGVIWDSSKGHIWWTDIAGSQIYRYELATRHLAKWPTRNVWVVSL